jgi:hypothetical protein
MKINIAKLTTKGIEKIESIKIGIDDYYEIPLEDNNKYMEHKRKRNKRIYKKMEYEYEREEM